MFVKVLWFLCSCEILSGKELKRAPRNKKPERKKFRGALEASIETVIQQKIPESILDEVEQFYCKIFECRCCDTELMVDIDYPRNLKIFLHPGFLQKHQDVIEVVFCEECEELGMFATCYWCTLCDKYQDMFLIGRFHQCNICESTEYAETYILQDVRYRQKYGQGCLTQLIYY